MRSYAGSAPHRGQGSGGITSQEILEFLLRRKGVIILSMIVGGLLAYHTAKAIPPWYTAEGLLVVDTYRSNAELDSARGGAEPGPWTGRSEAAALTSPQMVAALVDTLSLEQDPEFNPTLKKTWAENLAASAWMPGFLGRSLVGVAGEEEPQFDAMIKREVAREVAGALSAFSEERSYAIQVQFSGRDPEKGAVIVNALMDLYIQKQIELRRQTGEQSTDGVRQKLAELQNELEEARARVREEEGKTGLLQTQEGTIVTKDLQDLVEQRRRLRAQRDELAADLGELVATIAGGSLTALDKDLVTPRLEGLWADEAAARRRLAEESVELGERHPRRIALAREVNNIQDQIRVEASGIASSLERRIASLDSQDRNLRAQIQASQGEAAQAAQEKSRLVQLQDDVRAKQELYDSFRVIYERSLASLANIDLHGADVRVASSAVPPTKPSSPGAGLLTLIGLFAGLLASSGTIVGRRFLSSGFETLDDLSAQTGLPGLGAIPSVATWLKPKQSLANYIAEFPSSSVTETLRGILLRLNRSADTRRKIILVTSAEPAEGKTSFCIALGRTAAMDGLRCLVVDCDFRRPSVVNQTNLRPNASLNDFLDGSLDWGQDAVVKDPVSGMDMLMSKPTRSEMREFVNSTRLRVLIAEAREYYDLVIIDSPPVLRVPDAINLADTADALIFLASWRKTRRKLVQEALRRLEVAGRPIAGVVLSRMRGSVPEEYVYGGYPSA
jgi:capsular exopolysaccharide synthesis family protein